MRSSALLVAFAARIAELSPQPAAGVVDQGNGPLARLGRLWCRRPVATEQLHQRRCKLFGGAAGALPFEGMPVTVGDAQQLMQPERTVVGSSWPVSSPGALIGTVAVAQGVPMVHLQAILT